MEAADLALGIVLMLLGIAFIVVAVIRALRHKWTLGVYEVWVLPVAGMGLILLGRWLIQ
ncbi:MAG TPA: hypothetical protein VFZ64_05715 [Nocardioidaceae bacterium]